MVIVGAVAAPAAGQAAPAAKLRAKLLKRQVDKFSLHLRYHGPGKVAFSTLILSVKPPQGQGLAAQITKTQAAAVISHIRSDGFLGAAANIENKNTAYPKPKGPAYTMTVTGHGELYEDLGWGAKMLERLDALRRVFRNGSNAARALDKFLRHFELRRVKWAGKDIKVLRLQRSGDWSYELFFAAASTRSRRNVGLVTFKGVDLVTAKAGDYLWTPWGKLIFRRGRYQLGFLPTHWKAPQPKGNEVTGPDRATSQLIKARYASLHGALKESTFEIGYNGKPDEKLYSLALSAVDFKSGSSDTHLREHLTETQARAILCWLTREGLLASAWRAASDKLKAPQRPGYTITVRGPANALLHEDLGWGLKMLRQLDALREVLANYRVLGGKMDKLLVALEPQRKKWRKAAAAEKKAAERAKLLKKNISTFWLLVE